ncbi:MAG: hypothetical protein ACO1QS_07360, partial [Verrucomicrobiota bacterium]
MSSNGTGTISRRAVLKAGLGWAVVAPFAGWAAMTSAEKAVQQADEEVWKRFIDRRFDVVLHYAGRNGEVFLPTAEECRECQPNGMSWSTPIEDGAFFGGLYLAGLCLRYAQRKEAETEQKARRIAAGLMKLAEAGTTPGFVARGIGADGRAHYPASSEDQVFPWFYGLYAYLK